MTKCIVRKTNASTCCTFPMRRTYKSQKSVTCHDLRIPIGHSDPDNFHHFPLLEMSCWKEVLVSTQFVLYVVDLGEIKVSECCIYDQQSLHVLCRPSVQTKEHNVFIGQVRSEVSPQCAAAYILFSLLIVVTRKWNINDLLHSMPQSLCTFVILQVTHSFTDNFGKKKYTESGNMCTENVTFLIIM